MSCDRLLAACDYHKIIPMHATEHQPRLFLEKVAIQLLAADEADAPLPVFAFALERCKLLRCKLDLRAEVAICFEAALPDIRMMQKISDRQA